MDSHKCLTIMKRKLSPGKGQMTSLLWEWAVQSHLWQPRLTETEACFPQASGNLGKFYLSYIARGMPLEQYASPPSLPLSLSLSQKSENKNPPLSKPGKSFQVETDTWSQMGEAHVSCAVDLLTISPLSKWILMTGIPQTQLRNPNSIGRQKFPKCLNLLLIWALPSLECQPGYMYYRLLSKVPIPPHCAGPRCAHLKQSGPSFPWPIPAQTRVPIPTLLCWGLFLFS